MHLATSLALFALLASPSSGPRVAVPLDGPVDVDELLRLARIHQALNARLLHDYSWRQTTRSEALGRNDTIKRQRTRVYRVLPTPDGTERHLLEVDGDEPSRRMVRRQERRNRKVQERWRRARERRRREARQRGEAAVRQRPPAADAAPRPAARSSAAASPAPRPTPAGPASGTPDAPAGATPPAEDPPSAPTPPAPAGRSPAVARRAPVSQSPPAPTLPADVPPCDADDPSAVVRPPRRGVAPRSAAGTRRPSAAARRARESTGDYTIFELLSLTDYDYAGTCRWDDRVVHVVTFHPPEDFDPQNPVERVAMAMEGTILVDAAELQVVRAEGETVAPIRWGAGLVTLRSGHVIFENAKINDEIWLPAMDFFAFDSRVVLDRDRERITNYYDDYRKVVVTTSEAVSGVVGEPPAPP